MSDNQFWLSFFKTIIAAICIAILSGAGCTMNRHYQTRILIETAKINPIDASCAMMTVDDSGTTAICAVRATK